MLGRCRDSPGHRRSSRQSPPRAPASGSSAASGSSGFSRGFLAQPKRPLQLRPAAPWQLALAFAQTRPRAVHRTPRPNSLTPCSRGGDGLPGTLLTSHHGSRPLSRSCSRCPCALRRTHKSYRYNAEESSAQWKVRGGSPSGTLAMTLALAVLASDSA